MPFTVLPPPFTAALLQFSIHRGLYGAPAAAGEPGAGGGWLGEEGELPDLVMAFNAGLAYYEQVIT